MQQDATEHYLYLAEKSEYLQAWITTCEDYLPQKSWKLEIDINRIKYVIGQFKTL
jgi:hypothetical protein